MLGEMREVQGLVPGSHKQREEETQGWVSNALPATTTRPHRWGAKAAASI